MEIHQLKYFAALARERHFQKAADAVHISQPTLSQQLQKLERDLGVLLIERSPRHIKLTHAGEQFLQYALSALDILEKGEAAVKNADSEPTGSISLGAIPTIGPYILPSIIKKLHLRAPRVHLELHDLTTSSLLQNLKEGRLHMGLLALPINDKSIASRSIVKEPFYLAVSSHHPLAKKKSVTLKDFSQEHLLVLQEGHCFREQSLEYCKLASNSARIVFQGSSLISVMRLAAVGEGVTFVPHMAALPKENPKITFIPFSSPQPMRELGLVWRMSTPLNRAQNILIDIIEEELHRII